VIAREGKRVTRTEPAVFRAAALIGMSDFKHLFSPLGCAIRARCVSAIHA
jgi:hypothetical protein